MVPPTRNLTAPPTPTRVARKPKCPSTCFFLYSPLGEYYCHRPRSDSCRRDFNLVPLICRLWDALSTSGSSVHVYRFSTIFATDRVWFGCMSMYSSWKRQLLLCESCFAEALELPESFWFPTLHNPNVNMCPFAESSFWYQALQLFRILSPWQEILTNPTLDNLLYFEIVKVKVLFANGNIAQSSAFRTYFLRSRPVLIAPQYTHTWSLYIDFIYRPTYKVIHSVCQLLQYAMKANFDVRV